jgi:type IV fimbrial biogenesis protein FimT
VAEEGRTAQWSAAHVPEDFFTALSIFARPPRRAALQRGRTVKPQVPMHLAAGILRPCSGFGVNMHDATLVMDGVRRHRAVAPGSGPLPARGLTLVELLVTVSIAAILLALAAPTFSRFVAGTQLTSRTNDLVAALNLARSEAVLRGQVISLGSADGSLNYETGWSVFTDANADGVRAAPATSSDGLLLKDTAAAPGGTKVTRVVRGGAAPNFTFSDSSAADRGRVSFNGRGANAAAASAFFRVCDSAQRSIGGRIVQVSPVGKISLDSTTAACP